MMVICLDLVILGIEQIDLAVSTYVTLWGLDRKKPLFTQVFV